MKILNLYAGIGGNRKLWDNVDVTAVEINDEVAQQYENNFPQDEVVRADAHEFLEDHYDKFDFIWSSPPCQTHSRMNKANRHDLARYPDLRLYEEILFLKHWFNGKWVVENVHPYYEPLIPGQVRGRHMFWSNFHIPSFKEPKRDFNFSGAKCTPRDKIEEWLGIHVDGNIYLDGNHDPTQVLRNCVHPELGKHILEAARENKSESLTPFFS